MQSHRADTVTLRTPLRDAPAANLCLVYRRHRPAMWCSTAGAVPATHDPAQPAGAATPRSRHRLR
jgi:hypothetical protein